MHPALAGSRCASVADSRPGDQLAEVALGVMSSRAAPAVGCITARIHIPSMGSALDAAHTHTYSTMPKTWPKIVSLPATWFSSRR